MKRKWLLSVLILTFMCMGIVQPTGTASASGKIKLRVMDYNIHYGMGSDGVVNLERIAQVILASGADVIGLNEVDRYFDPRSNYEDQIGWLAERLGMYYAYGPSTYKKPIPASGNNRREHGAAVLSKYPIVSVSNRVHTEYDTHFRALLETKIDVQGKLFYFYVTHWGVEASDRLSQAEEALEWTGERQGPKLLVGDLNAEPNAPEIETILTGFSDAFVDQPNAYTFKSTNPTKRIDYILGNDYIAFENSTVIQSQASDHFPIVSDVTIDTNFTPDMKVMSYQINNGIGTDGRLDLDRIADVIERSGAEVIALQGVDRHYSARSGYVDQAGRIASRLGMYFAFGAFEQQPGNPESGNRLRERGAAVISKYPIVQSNVHLLDGSEAERTGVLEAQIDLNGERVTVFSTELGAAQSDRLQQANQISAIADATEGRRLLAIAARTDPSSPEMKVIGKQFQDALFPGKGPDTFPANAPNERTDHIWIDTNFHAREGATIDSQASNHLPVAGLIQLKPGEGRSR
ncbi:endonuclease/exonuclease/phosphatase family protein [Paenibacillus sp. HJGM_3]|uniref:endonuclease/exonuclease/phosphatase family protein n=1 Tax=Paenibacillus sp. HJGM_3 TaxID=3379816 RepID=UPI0038590A87